MSTKRRDRLYSQGQQYNKPNDKAKYKYLCDPKGYLLPTKTLSEFVYQQPKIEEVEEMVLRLKTGNNKLKRILSKVKTFFTSNSYFKTLFPHIKEQKPGKDLYLWIACIQFLLIIFLIPFYTRMERAYVSDAIDEFSTYQFSGTMVLAVFIQIGIIIFDRFLYLTRKFILIEKSEEDEDEQPTGDRAPNSYAKSRSMNKSRVSSFMLKTAFMQTYINKPDMPKQPSMKIFPERSKSTNNDDIKEELNDDGSNPEEEETGEIKLVQDSSNMAIMMKYYFQIFLLIFIHYFVFWHFPSSGNQQIQNQRFCNFDEANSENCNEVTQNFALFMFYIFYCLYFTISALQIRYGLPELRTASFVTPTSFVNKTIFEVYVEIPFLLEIKTITDWTFTRTALDLFQWIRLESIYIDLFIAKVDNKWYMDRPLGMPIGKIKKFFMGGLGLLLIVMLVAGPLAIFSSLNPATIDNRVEGSSLRFDIEVGRNQPVGPTNKFTVFQNNYVLQLQNINSHLYEELELGKNLQTKNFDKELFQVVEMSETSDVVWVLSPPNQRELHNILGEALQNINSTSVSVILHMQYQFDRPSPEGSSGQFESVQRNLMDKTVSDRESILRTLQKAVDPEISCAESQFAFVLKDFYSPVVRLTRSLTPSPIIIKNLTASVNVNKK